MSTNAMGRPHFCPVFGKERKKEPVAYVPNNLNTN
jgi:hypothetical protein